MMEKNHYKIHKDLLDVIRGYSQFTLLENTYYFKHFSIEESLEVEGFMQGDIESSVKSGIKTQSELLEAAKKHNAWSTDKEEKIKSLDWMIKRSTAALNKMQDENQRKVFNEQIETQRKELSDLNQEKGKIINYSAETLAETKKVSKMLDICLYKDAAFKEKPIDQERYALAPLMFSRYGDLNNRENILNFSYHGGFLDIYASQSNNPIALFGCTLLDMTIFQKNLIILTNSLLNKLKNTKIQDEISGDPVKIFEYEEKEEKEANVTHGIDDLKAKSKVRGGNLKAEDFLS